MPAAVRGARQGNAKPRAKAPASRGKARAASTAPKPAAKLRAAQGVLPPVVAFGAAGLVLVVGLVVALSTGHRGERLADGTKSVVAGQTAGAGFRLNKIHVQGASPMAQDAILAATGLHAGLPILDLDLEAIRAAVARVGWVKEVQVVRLLPDTLVVAVKERETLAVWQSQGRTWVIDSTGQRIPEADPGRFPQLPLIVGEGANETAAQILPAVQSRPRLRDRLEALVRVDGRRWDLRLKDGGIVQLPAVEEESALIQLDQLDQRQRILELGFERIDLRDPGLVALRPRTTRALPGEVSAAGV
ncbi:cell division protein FtsQ/DivIB [Caulobacter mirabilis]|uniref:Cell division protein FtsQ n=1 Tax=Caulobacter mirabilis TaxID=69666 RepID=A0A2D2B0L0_9CAUL|nr:cell division protein FtsQ/DivIB [Caulobacter mirabilis]ATQ43792.1 cell division protein FtsQ [Caulobacter mirabilis]